MTPLPKPDGQEQDRPVTTSVGQQALKDQDDVTKDVLGLIPKLVKADSWGFPGPC